MFKKGDPGSIQGDSAEGDDRISGRFPDGLGRKRPGQKNNDTGRKDRRTEFHTCSFFMERQRKKR
jgi:hypothetical protein